MEKAYCVGALVDWETLKAIREIQEERRGFCPAFKEVSIWQELNG